MGPKMPRIGMGLSKSIPTHYLMISPPKEHLLVGRCEYTKYIANGYDFVVD